DAMTSQQADELHRSREQVRLSLHVVAVHARTEALQDGRLGPAREILREIQLASVPDTDVQEGDRKSTRLNSSHEWISYAVFCLLLRPPAPPPFPYTTLFRS